MRTERLFGEGEVKEFLRDFCDHFCAKPPLPPGYDEKANSKHHRPIDVVATETPLAEGLWALRADRLHASRAQEIAATLAKIESFSSLRRLSLAGNFQDDASAADIAKFAGAMKEYIKSDVSAQLEELDLSDNALGKGEIELIASPLDSHPSLTLLNLKGNRMGRTGAEHLAKARSFLCKTKFNKMRTLATNYY